MSSKADYLKKYLDSDKKRKKKKVKSRGNLTVKDTDVGWDDIKPASDDEFKPTIGQANYIVFEGSNCLNHLSYSPAQLCWQVSEVGYYSNQKFEENHFRHFLENL